MKIRVPNRAGLYPFVTMAVFITTCCFGFTSASANWFSAKSPCDVDASVNKDDAYKIIVSDSKVKTLSGTFFGFNLESVDFQDSLWNVSQGRVNQDVISYMRAFPGAVYRYPGGTVSNYFDWSASVGAPEDRPNVKLAPWKEADKEEFGFHEYLDFVSQVGGHAWLVTNLYGDFQGEESISELAQNARNWAVDAKSASNEILRWELGNELDRGRVKWPPEEYASRALTVAQAIKSVDHNARFVAMVEEYNAQRGISAKEYNQTVAQTLSPVVSDFAIHLYYDGKPGGPNIPFRLKQLCNSEDAIAAVGIKNPGIWVTEHARALPNPGDKYDWWRATSLQGALSVADMMIAATQLPDVNGAFVHTLGGVHGPWTFFQRNDDGKIYPSAVYWALRDLRDGMLGDVLATSTYSPNNGGYQGGYDIRATALTNHDRSKYALWIVNHSNSAHQINVTFPQLTGRKMQMHQSIVGDMDINTSNSASQPFIITPHKMNGIAVFDNGGNGVVNVPRNSVSVFLFE